jgi:predicted alpha/beta superfamily hydrolase
MPRPFALFLCLALLGVSACVPETAPRAGEAGLGLTPQAAGAPSPSAFPRHVLARTEIRTPPDASGRADQLYVALPASYAREPQRRYPVVYLCDGYWDFVLVYGFTGNLLYDRAVPEFILVGLGYQGESPDYDRLRAHDYTPVVEGPGNQGRDTGHAAEYLHRLEHDILPFVDRSYRTDPSYRVLGGSSLGGLFTLYALFERPELFRAFIAPSPAVTWANRWLFEREAAFAKEHREVRARLFMTGASAEDPGFLAGIRAFDAQLAQRRYQGLAYEFRMVEGERHAGTKAESYNRGLRFAFAPIAPQPAGP